MDELKARPLPESLPGFLLEDRRGAAVAHLQEKAALGLFAGGELAIIEQAAFHQIVQGEARQDGRPGQFPGLKAREGDADSAERAGARVIGQNIVETEARQIASCLEGAVIPGDGGEVLVQLGAPASAEVAVASAYEIDREQPEGVEQLEMVAVAGGGVLQIERQSAVFGRKSADDQVRAQMR